MAINALSFPAVCNLVLWIGCAIVYYRFAQIENLPGWYWAAPSLIVFYITWHIFGWGPIANVFGQLILLIAIGAVRAWRDFRSGGPDQSA